MTGFDEQAYLRLNADVAVAVKAGQFSSGREHWLLNGCREGRVCSEYAVPGSLDFDEAVYLLQNPDVATSVRNSAFRNGYEHWVRYGRAEGRSAPGIGPVPNYFDEESYLRQNKDVAQAVREGAFANGYEHWVKHGQKEGRRIRPQVPDAPDEFDEALYLASNPDLAAAVKAGAIQSGYSHWVEYGRYEGRRGAPALEQIRKLPVEQISGTYPTGVNYFGLLQEASGLGQAARGYLAALREGALPIHQQEVPRWDLAPAERLAFDLSSGPYAINILHQNADMMPLFQRAYGREVLPGRYNIGMWVWELHAAYATAYRASQALHEIWVPSEFVGNALRNLVSVPVVCVPYVVEGTGQITSIGRSHFGIDPDAFVFYFSFDLSSGFTRKNAVALLVAFSQAFAGHSGVQLLLKCGRSRYDQRSGDLLQALASRNSNVRVLDGEMSREDTEALYRCVDCYVSPHRSEGFGLTIAEAMWHGTPVIATGYSGNMEFTTAANSFLLDYELVPVPAGEAAYQAGYVWAEPDVGHLVHLLQTVYNSDGERRKRAELGQQTVNQLCSRQAIAQKMKERLKAIGFAWSTIDR